MFLDIVKIFVKAGSGGDGCISFHREKYVEFGGPNGGNGGNGGNVFLITDKGMGTLYDFKKQKHFEAEGGKNGKGSNMHGKQGKDLYIKVPLGTQVFFYDEATKEKTFKKDLIKENEIFMVASGGKGGRGNLSFKTQTRTAPRIAEKGEKGEEKTIILELKLIASIGLLGYPNAGKSTFLSSITNAKPKIADYPFTTIHPNLGVIKYYDRHFLVADIPGIIEGAHKGLGLGFDFLKHIERTKILFHLLDVNGYENSNDLYTNFLKMNDELFLYNPKIFDKKQIVLITKMDSFYETLETRAWLNKSKEKIMNSKYKVEKIFEISSVSKFGIKEFLDYFYEFMKNINISEIENTNIEEQIPEITLKRDFKIVKIKDGIFEIHGEKIEKLVDITYLDEPEALNRFQNIMRKLGIDDELMNLGIKEQDIVKIGEYEFYYQY